MALHLVPIRFRDACQFVADHHRHHSPPQGLRFCVGVADKAGVLRGVAIVGCPVTRLFDDGQTVEVTRVASDGTRNACSMLYGAAWRAAKALGYSRLITYTQQRGRGLPACRWLARHRRTPAAPRLVARPSRPRGNHSPTGVQRTLWEAS